MTDFTPKKIDDISQLNNGKEYINGVDIPDADDWNKVIESQLFTQGLAVNEPDVSEAGNVGTPSVEIIKAQDGSAKLKFKDLKGATGRTGNNGTNGTDGEDGSKILFTSSILSSIEILSSGDFILPELPINVGDMVISVEAPYRVGKVTMADSSVNTYSVEPIANMELQGNTGEKGKDALIYKPYFYDEEYNGDFSGDVQTLNISDFNRTPIVNETFQMYLYSSVEGNEGKLINVRVLTVGSDTITATYVSEQQVAPVVSASAEIDNNVGVPDVTVDNQGTWINPNFHFTFKNLKGQTGQTGQTGAPSTLVGYSIAYANGLDGTNHPSTGWVSLPNPAKGNYLWTRVTTTFNTGNPVISYSVTYVGKDGDPADTSKFVTTDTIQNIVGYKRFVDGINIGISQEDGGVLDENAIIFAGDVAEEYIRLYAKVSEINDSFNIKIPAKSGTIALTSDLTDKITKADLLNYIYPVGSVYLSVNTVSPASFLGGSWTYISAGRALWTTTTTDAGTYIDAGLPNITGSITNTVCEVLPSGNGTVSGSGAFAIESGSTSRYVSNAAGSATRPKKIWFNASTGGSTLYGQSSTVQPSAYKVNAWRRTA